MSHIPINFWRKYGIFGKSRRKLRTKNFEAHFHRKLRTLEKCSNVKKLRTTEPQPLFTGSYKKKRKKCIKPIQTNLKQTIGVSCHCPDLSAPLSFFGATLYLQDIKILSAFELYYSSRVE